MTDPIDVNASTPKRGSLFPLVFTLSVLLSLAVGFIGGYFTYYFQLRSGLKSIPFSPADFSSFQSSDLGTSYNYKSPHVEVLYYNPGNDFIWTKSYSEISEGAGAITGRFMFNDKPPAKLDFALIFANGRKTKTVSVNSDGTFSIPIEKGKYFFNGIVIYDGPDNIDGLILVNKLSVDRTNQSLLNSKNNEEILEKYESLAKKIGPEEAAASMLDAFQTVFEKGNQFELNVGETPVEFAPFHFRDPIRVLSPTSHDALELDKIKFIWKPFPLAASYTLEITEVTKKGTSTHFSNTITVSGIKENTLTLEAFYFLQQANAALPFNPDCNIEPRQLQANKLYCYAVYAFNEGGEILSGTSVRTTDGAQFMTR